MTRFVRGTVSLALFALFGVGALFLSLFAALSGGPERCHRVIRASWRLLLWLFEATWLIRIETRGLARCEGCVVVANHPSLIDVVILVALVPKALFVAKHALTGNPFMSLIVRNAALPDDERLPDVARGYLEKGWNVLIFPEGTRSPASGLRRFRRGAANMAIRCGAPVELISIRQSRRILGKDQKPWDMGDRTVVYSLSAEGPVAYAQAPGESVHAAAVRAAEDIHERLAKALGGGAEAEETAACGRPAFLSNVAAVVPVFEPEPVLPKLCGDLLEKFGMVVVVDDGSTRSLEAFSSLPEGVALLRHDKNRGKGAAMKTAMSWLVGKVDGAVFVDGDGQHDPGDALAVAARMLERDETVLGTRDMEQDFVPARSRAGNAWMRYFLWLLFGLRISDTQTGLRAFPERLFERLAAVRGERYEYEMRMLAMLHRVGEEIGEVRIKTIYERGNKSSHLRPFWDSVRVLFGFFGERFVRQK